MKKKKNDYVWGESPEDCLILVVVFIVVLILIIKFTGAWEHPSHEDEPDVTATTTITEEVITNADS